MKAARTLDSPVPFPVAVLVVVAAIVTAWLVLCAVMVASIVLYGAVGPLVVLLALAALWRGLR